MNANWQQMFFLTGKNILSNTDSATTNWIGAYIPQEDQPYVQTIISQAVGQDNGKGIGINRSGKGIGLKTIQDRYNCWQE